MTDTTGLEEAAEALEAVAMQLAHRDVEPLEAIDKLIEVAGGNVLITRRAHRHCERAVAEQWPAAERLLRSFFYLSAARRKIEGEDS